MTNLTITQRQSQNVTIFDLTGKIIIGEPIVYFRKSLRELTEDNKRKILLNLENITHIDSSGLGELVAAYLDAKKNGSQLKLLHLTRQVSELMRMTKLLTVFETFEDEAEAVKSFQTNMETATVA